MVDVCSSCFSNGVEDEGDREERGESSMGGERERGEEDLGLEMREKRKKIDLGGRGEVKDLFALHLNSPQTISGDSGHPRPVETIFSTGRRPTGQPRPVDTIFCTDRRLQKSTVKKGNSSV